MLQLVRSLMYIARTLKCVIYDFIPFYSTVDIQNTLKAKGVMGNYCPYGNLHMTLAFIGENYNLLEICNAVGEVEFEPFALTLDRLGTFSTKTVVIWCGVKETEPVTTIANRLRERLSAHGVNYNSTAFYPHISLVRQPANIITDIDIPQTSISVDRIVVMKSERIDGKLIYWSEGI